MNLNGVLSIATSGLRNIDSRLALVANNIANVSTPDYTAESGRQESLFAGGQAAGVRTNATERDVDLALQRSAFQQDSVVAGLTTTTTSLSTIDAVLGTPGQGNDIASLLGKVQDAFSSLQGDPSNASRQSAVTDAATRLTTGINELSAAYARQRQSAHDDLVYQVSAANDQLRSIGDLSSKIVAARSAGQSTADLENQRDAAIHGLGKLVGIKTFAQSSGDLSVFTTSGTELPTRAATGPLSLTAVSIGPDAWYPGGGIPGVTIAGRDVTAQLQGGQIGANLTLRDQTLPRFQAELDEFSHDLAGRFDAQGLTLFTDPSGAVPAGGGTPVQAGYVGFAASIQVNPAVAANPSQVRDGTHDVAGSPAGASAFTVNPAGGPAGFGTLIQRVLTYALGTEAQSGMAQTAGAASGLGPDGTLSTTSSTAGSLGSRASSLVSTQSAVSATASGRLSTEQTVQTALTAKLASTTGVNIDKEAAHMVELQNAYQANARIIGVMQTLFNQLLQAVA